ncbi:MAG: hypothetical protein DRN65_03145 [Thaumarchaeota archaeon]|nr:MAG: hypothetical protein DRN65_03145 [Nitrososphaerota archaeon]
MLEALYFGLIAAAFLVTTAVFLRLYLKISREIRSPIKAAVKSDNEALKRLKEVLSQREEADLRELLDELREIKSKIEELIDDEERGSVEGEGGGDNGGIERN